MPVAALLRKIPFFQGLAEEQLLELALRGTTKSWKAGSVVFQEGDAADKLYLILEGSICVYRTDPKGRPVPLASLAAGDFFGEIALFDGSPRSASVAAVDDCELFALERDDFWRMATASPHLLPEMLAGFSARMRAVNEKFFGELLQKESLRAEMEKERYRSLAQMVAGVAHEINTPLGIVNTAASFLGESLAAERLALLARDDESQALLQDILEASRLIQGNLARATKLVQTFKSLSISQVTDAKEVRDLPALIEEIVSLYQPQARRARLEIYVQNRLQEGAREWTGYPGYLSQILLNLFTNVERYAYPQSSGGKVEVTLSADADRGEPCFVLLLRDFGQGIGSTDLPRIFEAFFTTGRSQGGAGLGLAIVHNLVTEAMGGTIEVQSQPGEGTTFIVTLPKVAPDSADQRSSAQ